MQQEVVVALMRSSTLFISYLGGLIQWPRLMAAAAAHDQAHNRSGKTVTPADVLKAISELDFGPADQLIPLLERELSGTSTCHASLTGPAFRAKSKKGRKSEGA